MRPLHIVAAGVVGVCLSLAAFVAMEPGPGDPSQIVPRRAVAFDPPAPGDQNPSENTVEKVQQPNLVRVFSKSAYDITPLSRERVAELASQLDEEAYRVTQKAGTEAPFCGTLLDNHKDGVYCCVVCGLPLFASANKFTSGTGWPSFYQPFDPQHVKRIEDRSHGMLRTEIACARCGAHLGHVFDDGPKPTGERHCLNSASLVFYEKGAEMPRASRPIKTETAYFAGGCFWGVEHYFDMGPGVIDAVSGYMQGHTDNPTYKEVCAHGTGHAETVKVVFDPSRISYRRLVEAFFAMHDPTQLNRQGPDVGDQYRSGIWVTDPEQRKIAEEYIVELERAGAFKKPIVTQVEQAQTFWPAEEYHQDYVAVTGRACHVANPWTKAELTGATHP
jgi:peptide methionine sulfoxide reductase msrA/msrB